MVGALVTFTSTENTYEIASVGDAQTVTLTEALDGDGVADAFTVTQYAVFDLPANFANLKGQRITFAENKDVPYIIVAGEARVRDSLRRSSSVGRPQLAAVRPKPHGGSDDEEQRYELVLWPRPDRAYVLEYRYQVLVSKLATGKYPIGGMEHGETIEAACMAAIERELEGPGPQDADFVRMLEVSKRKDNEHAPDYFGGRNLTSPDVERLQRSGLVVTYNGNTYPGVS
jgi:hypothetical protein